MKIDELLDPISDLADLVPFSPERQILVTDAMSRAVRMYAETMRLAEENRQLASTLESVRRYAKRQRCDCGRYWPDRFEQGGCLKMCTREELLSCLSTQDEEGGE